MKTPELKWWQHFTHRCIFSTFAKEELLAKIDLLRQRNIEAAYKAHNSNVLGGGTVGQLSEYQVSYDLYVRNRDYDLAAGLVGKAS